MFTPKSAGLHLLESLLPPEIWKQIQKASTDIPKIVEGIQETMQSVNDRLKRISEVCDRIEEVTNCCYARIARVEMKFDPTAIPDETGLSLLNERVMTNTFSDDDENLMRETEVKEFDEVFELPQIITDMRKPN